ncbi:Mak10 subunit, NatC N-terminal acetyltransferase-domain-containing protein [Absidia repens]|uniref:Mak10 subunit, NatC N-terminal acetyltransferase-domain-containing protein n=1 Tax=Absidia repens TaxID=90262 RepID=A0A1X2IH02_9FUNG|nr:Mak10 subunit, NatC N-terminal acetyltransferase-domain-containing protein [Absidia repens]
MNQFPLRDIRNAISSMNITGANGKCDQSDPSFLTPPWKDITTFLDQATQDMKEGELIHLQSFTLFDAMSAIEIMDPRMDTGMVIETDQANIDYDIEQALTPPQTLWIMDQLLACEMAWLSGHSLAQTVYTCIYFHHVPSLNKQLPSLASMEPTSVEHLLQVVLGAYILGTVKCCYHIWNEMISGNIYEEEDFTTNLFGLSLYEDIPDVDVLNKVEMALHMLKMYIDSNESIVLSALYKRLLLRQQTLMYLRQLQCRHVDDALSTLTKVGDLLDDSITKTPASIFGTLKLGQPVAGAFDPNINRKLTSQAPPRAVTLQSHQESYEAFLQIVRRLESICTITKISSASSLINYFTYFAGNRPYPDAFSRSKLNSLFYYNGRIFGTYPVTALVQDSIFDYVQPPIAWFEFDDTSDPKPLADAKASLQRFLDQTAAMPLVYFFKVQCHNRARQRRIFCKVLGEWEVLQDEALHLDKKFYDANTLLYGRRPDEQTMTWQNTYHFSLWAYNMKMKMMEQILLLGFELDLYGETEYTTIYWYYWYLQSVLEKCYEQQEGNNGNNRVARSHYTQQLNSAKKEMAIGTFKLLLAAKKENRWPPQQDKELRFDDPETRFNHRLKPFTKIASPPFQGFDRFQQDSSTDHLHISTLLNAAENDFIMAKGRLEVLTQESVEVSKLELCYDASRKTLLSMVKICAANSDTIQQLLKLDNGSATKVTLTFEEHPWWPVMQLEK